MFCHRNMLEIVAWIALSWLSFTGGWMERAEAADVGCDVIYEVYGHAVAHGKEKQFIDLAEAYYECLLLAAEASPDTDEVMAYLKAKDQVGDRVKTESYQGKIEAHALIVKAGFALVKGLQAYAKIPYVSSLVRTEDQQRKLLRHPILKSQASRRSMHLGGMAVDVAFIGRKIGMKRMSEHARSVLVQALGPSQADLLRIVKEPYCLHIELNRKHPVSAKMVEKRKAKLLELGILKRTKTGVVPHIDDYVSEAAWSKKQNSERTMSRR